MLTDLETVRRFIKIKLFFSMSGGAREAITFFIYKLFKTCTNYMILTFALYRDRDI